MYENCDTSPDDSIFITSPTLTRISTVFRSPSTGQGGSPWGSERINADSCFVPEGDNWATCDGDKLWHEMADELVCRLDTFFTDQNYDTLAKYIWGFNLLVENPAVGRKMSNNPTPWHGCWAAVDRVLNGKNSHFKANFNYPDTMHEGFRGITFYDNKERMVVAKNSLAACIRSDYNVFQWLPDIDAWVLYTQPVRSWYNYGDQIVFDYALYGEDEDYGPNMNGYQYYAEYMQDYGEGRRLIVGLSMEWQFDKTDVTKSTARRPCPPEIRCMCYLALSRGYKGILFHPWLNDYSSITEQLDPEEITIPDTSIGYDKTMNCYNLGLRDQQGYPFGYPGRTQYLNESAPQAPTWDNAQDNTYSYLKDTLIPEIKAISGVLMQLEWVNAYSLKSTCGKDTFCPLYYVDSVTTTDSGYIDLGFFKPYQWQDCGKYLMVVNRDGIADNEPDSITLYLDFPEGDSLYVVEYGDPNTSYFLVKDTSDNRFHLSKDYAPGEGKLFRIEEYV